MRHSAFTMDNFFAFMNQAMAAGIFEPSQQKEWKRFVPDIPELLNQPEKDDLRKLEIAGLHDRYLSNLHKKSLMASSWLIFQRKKLLTRAVGEFVAFSVNPARYWADHGKRKPVLPGRTEPVSATAQKVTPVSSGIARVSPTASSPAVPRQTDESAARPQMTADRTGKALVPAQVHRAPQPRRETGIEYQNRLLKNPSAVQNPTQTATNNDRRREPFVSNF